ncbi:MAG TPA: rhomboid family intramembrane serine protease [Acidimicrobiia bacterium]|nr:rhomboid family intramembrane serine protease [Acidimicrobiia bacterium]
MKAAGPTAGQRITMMARGQNLLATKSIIGLTAIAFVVIGLRDANFNGTGPTANRLVLYGPLVHHGEWYRIFTVSLVHAGLLHLFFNMILLWIVGQLMEPGAGPVRFGLLYVVSVAAGSAGAIIATPHAVSAGASGGVFGVAAAATIVMQRQGVRFWDTGFGPLIIINLVLDSFTPQISIAAHIGGAIGGLLAAEAMLQSRKAGRPELGILGAALVGVVAVVLCLVLAKPF